MQNAIPHYPDRVHMRHVVIPLICERGVQRVLSVGCQRYSVEIETLLKARNIDVWTLDADPATTRWGSRDRHIIGDARHIDEIDRCYGFDCVILNGVLGFGIDTRKDIERTFLGLSRIMKPGSLLVLGWNVDLVDSPWSYDHCALFRRSAVSDHPSTFEDSTHAYEYLERVT